MKTKQKKTTKHFLSLIAMLFLAWFFCAQTTSAVFSPGETLDPNCLPSDSDCTVSSPASSGANSDITSLSGLATPLSVSQGGTGLNSISANSLIYSPGANTLTTLSLGSNGQVLKINEDGDLEWAEDAGGTSYTAGSGLSLAGSAFFLNLANANTWSGLQSFDGGISLGGNTYTDLAGTGLSFSGGTLSSSLGTAIDSSEITDGMIIAADIADNTLTFAKIASNSCSANEIMKWNGSAWACSIDNNDTYTAGSGLALSSGAFSLDINGLSAVSSINSTDTVAVYTASGIKKITRSDMFSDVLGAMNYRGTWNATTNSPDLSTYCAAGTKGHYYVVGTSGTTNLSGIASWAVNDWAVCNGASWEKVQTTNAVTSVFGRTGAVVASGGDYNASQITNTPNGNIAAISVQNALNELDSEKLATGLNSGLLWLGNASNQAAAVSMSGDVTMNNAGVTTIGADKVALGTDTTGNYVATLADSGAGIFNVSNSGSENAAVTIGLNNNVLDLNALKNPLTLDASKNITLGGNDVTFAITGGGLPKYTRTSAGQWMNFADGTDSFSIYNIAGTPEASIAADKGSLAVDTTNGALYIKTTDTLNTGWSAFGLSSSGINSLNGLTGLTQTFATSSTGTDFAITSSGTTHTFSIPNASATARGLITTETQTIAGAKTFSSAITAPTSANTINGLVINSGALSKVASISADAGLAINSGTGDINFTGHIIPSAANTYDIGSATNPIRDLYVSNNSIKVGGISLSNNSGTLTWAGGAIQATSGSSSFDSAGITVLNATTANITNLALSGALNVPGNFTVNTNKFSVNGTSGNTTVAGTLGVTGAITGPTSTNTINGLIVNSGALSGATTLSLSGAITGATSTNTINGLVINSGALSGITGITMASGNADMANGLVLNIGNAGTDFTSGGGLNLVGDFTINTNKFTVASSTGNTSIAGTLNSTGLVTGAAGFSATTGGLELANSVPATTTNKIYNNAGTLYWNGSAVNGTSQWTTNGTDIYYNGGKVGIGTANPGSTLEVAGTLNILAQAVTNPSFNSGEGTVTTVGSDVVVTYSTVGTDSFTVPTGVTNVRLLVVGGGGGASSGGGGAGRMITASSVSVTPGSTHTITVGDGGSGVAGSNFGGFGGASSFGSLAVAPGGGAGASLNMPGANGGSGGGAGRDGQGSLGGSASVTGQTLPAGGSSYGNNGGRSSNSATWGAGGGGGGAGAVGGNGSPDSGGTDANENAGDGGVGRQDDITGTNTYYAGGGGSGRGRAAPANGYGGLGGGGNGGTGSGNGVGGTGGTGGGGGGHGGDGGTGGAGGSGIVIVRFTSQNAAASALAVTSAGSVGIGTSAPTVAKLVINETRPDMDGLNIKISDTGNTTEGTGAIAWFENISTNSSADGVSIKLGPTSNPGTGNNYVTFLDGDGTVVGQIEGTGAGGISYAITSDMRAKKNVVDTKYSLENLLKIKVRDFNYLSSDKITTGFIAQELYEQYPEAVSKPEIEDEMWGVDYGKLTPLLVKSIQEQQGQIEQHSTGIVALDLRTKNVVAAEEGKTVFKGMIVADTLKANRIEGLDVVTGSQLSDVDAQLVAHGQTLHDITEQLTLLQTKISEPELSLKLKDLQVSGGVTFKGSVEFQGPAVFKALAEFMDKVIFRKDVQFQGEVTFNANTTGTLTIPKGKTRVRVTFAKPFSKAPIVNLTPTESVYVSYSITDVTSESFTVEIFPAEKEDLTFNWIALIFQGDGTKVDVLSDKEEELLDKVNDSESDSQNNAAINNADINSINTTATVTEQGMTNSENNDSADVESGASDVSGTSGESDGSNQLTENDVGDNK